MTDTEMEHLLQRIKARCEFLYKKESFWKRTTMDLFPAAPESEVERLSARLPRPLPPSYRQFLRLHNGCVGFWPRFFLRGTSGESADVVDEKVKDAWEFQGRDVREADGTISSESVRRYESQPVPEGRPRYYFLAAYCVFGTNRAGEFVFFDHTQTDEEPAVIDYTFSGRIEDRHPNFYEYLRGTLARMEARIAQKKY